MIENVGAQVILRNWWMVASQRVARHHFGLIALFFPGIALLAFIFVFAAYAIIDGIVAVIVAVRERGFLGRWGWVLFEGILSILAGILAFAFPGITALVLLYIVAAWAIVTGILEIVAAFVLREYVSREWLLALAGIFYCVRHYLVRPPWRWIIVHSLVGWDLQYHLRDPVHHPRLSTSIVGIVSYEVAR